MLNNGKINNYNMLKTEHTACLCLCFLYECFSVCVCVSCAAGPSLLGVMASNWVIFPLVPNEEDDPGRFPSPLNSTDAHKINMQTKIDHTHSHAHAHLWTEEVVGCMGWTFLSGDSYRTTSNNKSKSSRQPFQLHCYVLHSIPPSAPQLNAFHSLATRTTTKTKSSRLVSKQ